MIVTGASQRGIGRNNALLTMGQAGSAMLILTARTHGRRMHWCGHFEWSGVLRLAVAADLTREGGRGPPENGRAGSIWTGRYFGQ